MSICRRRDVLATTIAATAMSLKPTVPFAASNNDALRPFRTPAQLQPRSEFVIRHAYIMTMDRALPDLADASIHVKDGRIVSVGSDGSRPGVHVIDGTDHIVMPGLIDTHWHMWNTLYRSFSGDQPSDGYFPTVAKFGKMMTPDDVFKGTRLAAAEAINSGITTVHSWCHNVRSRQHAEADIAALRELGLRGRWSCGWMQGLPDNQMMDLSIVEGLHRDWEGLSPDRLLSLGFGWRGQFRVDPLPESVYRPELEKARSLGIPVSVHVGSARSSTGQVAKLANDDLLGPDMQLVHVLSATPEEFQMIRAAGACVSVSPGTELRIGYGFSPITEVLAAGIPLGISVDTVALTGNANLFAILKLGRDVQNAKAESEFKMTARRALEIGTIEGARSLGIDHLVGTLTPGKRADLIMISTNALNMGAFRDPSHLVLESVEPENVKMVVVDGRVLKNNGRLTALDTESVIREARTAVGRIRARVDVGVT